MNDKKGQVNKLTGFALTIVVFAVVIGVGLNIVSEVRQNECPHGWCDVNQQCLNSTGGTGGDLGLTFSYNSTEEIQQGMADVPGWVPIIIVATIGGIVLFLVIRQFG